MMLTRIGLGLTWRRGRSQVWRVASITLAVIVLTSGVLLAVALVSMNAQQHQRAANLVPMLSEESRASDVLVRPTEDRIDGRSILVQWIAPAASGDDPPALPGMTAFPAPGCAWVSPALDALLTARPGLADRYGCRDVLASDGVVTGGQLVAYVRPADDAAVGPVESAISLRDGVAAGDGPAIRYATVAPLATPDLEPVKDIVIGMLAFAVAPALLLLWISLSTLSDRRTHRFGVLRELGCPSSAIQRIAAAEVLSIAGPVSLAVAAAWAAASPHVTGVPVLDFTVVPGDLAVGPATALLGAAGVMTVVLLLSAVRELVPRRSTRRSSHAVGAKILPALPILAASALLTSSMFMGRSALAVDFRYIGALLAVIGAPFLVPPVVASVAERLSTSPRWVMWVSGRAMERRSKHFARPFMGLAGLCALVVLGLSYITALTAGETPGDPTPTSSSASVGWVAEQPQALAALQGSLDSSGDTYTVLPYASATDGGDHAHEGEEGEHLLLGATCDSLIQHRLVRQCSEDPRIWAAESRLLVAEMSSATSEYISEVDLVDPTSLPDARSAMVIGSGDAATADAEVRAAAFASVEAPEITSLDNQTSMASAQAVGWITAGVTVGPLILIVAALISAANHVMSSRRQWRLLVNLGLDRRRLIGLDAVHLAVPWACAMGLGLVIGAMASSSIEEVPWAAAAVATMSIAVVYGLMAATISVIGLRSALPERE